MQIETERLILREMNEEDFDDLYCVLAVSYTHLTLPTT